MCIRAPPLNRKSTKRLRSGHDVELSGHVNGAQEASPENLAPSAGRVELAAFGHRTVALSLCLSCREAVSAW